MVPLARRGVTTGMRRSSPFTRRGSITESCAILCRGCVGVRGERRGGWGGREWRSRGVSQVDKHGQRLPQMIGYEPPSKLVDKLANAPAAAGRRMAIPPSSSSPPASSSAPLARGRTRRPRPCSWRSSTARAACSRSARSATHYHAAPRRPSTNRWTADQGHTSTSASRAYIHTRLKSRMGGRCCARSSGGRRSPSPSRTLSSRPARSDLYTLTTSRAGTTSESSTTTPLSPFWTVYARRPSRTYVARPPLATARRDCRSSC